MEDPSRLYEEARAYAHFPGGHNEGYPVGLKNLFRNVYGYITKQHRKKNFATFQDGHNEIAICDAVLKSAKLKKWVEVKY